MYLKNNPFGDAVDGKKHKLQDLQALQGGCAMMRWYVARLQDVSVNYGKLFLPSTDAKLDVPKTLL